MKSFYFNQYSCGNYYEKDSFDIFMDYPNNFYPAIAGRVNRTYVEELTELEKEKQKIKKALNDITEKVKKIEIEKYNIDYKYSEKRKRDFDFAIMKDKIFNSLEMIIQLCPDFCIEDLKKLFPNDKGLLLCASSFYTDLKKSKLKQNQENVKLLEDLKKAGIVLSNEQELFLNNYYSKIKDSKKIMENVERAKQNNKRLSDERFLWQKDSNHPDNVRSKALLKAKKIVEILINVRDRGIISEEQFELLQQQEDFIKYSRKINDDSIDIMVPDVRKEFIEFYEQQDESRGKSK